MFTTAHCSRGSLILRSTQVERPPRPPGAPTQAWELLLFGRSYERDKHRDKWGNFPSSSPPFYWEKKHNQTWGCSEWGRTARGDGQLTAKLEARRPGWGRLLKGADAQDNWHETTGKGGREASSSGRDSKPSSFLDRVSWLPGSHQNGFREWGGCLGRVGQFGGWEALVELNLKEKKKKKKTWKKKNVANLLKCQKIKNKKKYDSLILYRSCLPQVSLVCLNALLSIEHY